MESTTNTPTATADRSARTKEILGEILRLMGLQATLEAKEDGDHIAVAITASKEGEEMGLRAGHRTQVLDALQVVLNRAVNRANEPRRFVSVDVGDFRQEEDPELVEMAKRLAAKAAAIGKPIAVGPMNARDRRQVHLALAGVPGIKTQSEGEGIARRLLIIPVSANQQGQPPGTSGNA